jgi:hypothetical protein
MLDADVAHVVNSTGITTAVIVINIAKADKDLLITPPSTIYQFCGIHVR